MYSVDFGWFILSQTIYGIGGYAIMSALFKLRFYKHITIISIIAGMTSIINYLIYFNKEDDIGFIVPIIGILITFLYLAAVEKVPLVWSLVVTVVGSLVVPILIQLGIVFGSFGFFMPEALKEHIWRNYALDITSGFIFSLVAFVLYSQGWGFKFNYEKVRFKREKYIIITISILAGLTLPIIIVITHLSKVTLNLTFLAAISLAVFLVLLRFALMKEQREPNTLNQVTEVNKYV